MLSYPLGGVKVKYLEYHDIFRKMGRGDSNERGGKRGRKKEVLTSTDGTRHLEDGKIHSCEHGTYGTT
jgi:hypothetical protein